MSVGCLLGLLLLKLFDSRKVLVGAVISAVIFLSLALFGPGNISAACVSDGRFFAFGNVVDSFSLALNSLDSHHGSFAGILCTAIIGGALMQIFIGWLGDMFGLRTSMCLIYVTLGYIFSIGLWPSR